MRTSSTYCPAPVTSRRSSKRRSGLPIQLTWTRVRDEPPLTAACLGLLRGARQAIPRAESGVSAALLGGDHLRELLLIEVEVVPALAEQALVRAALDDAAAVQHQHLVGSADRR